MKGQPLKILVLSQFDAGNANVIRDYLFSFHAYSRHSYYYIFNCREIEPEFDFSRFDVILIFWSAWLFSPPGCPSPLSGVMDKIGEAPALKVLFLQDEYRHVRVVNRVMARLGINIMFTCVAEDDHGLFYPKSIISSLQETYTVLPGYVPAYLENPVRFKGLLASERRIDVGYRSRSLSYCLGDLGQEKTEIAERFGRILAEKGFSTDISASEDTRIYGRKWIEFLKSCRMALGTESGASVVDFTSEIEKNCGEYLKKNPKASYREVKQLFFADADWKVVIATISPRIFEVTACANTMVLYEGRYAGCIHPDVHYISVKKDYSNIDDVIEKMRDRGFCGRLAENAYRDLIASGEYSYKSFIGRFDGIIEEHLGGARKSRTVSPLRFYRQRFWTHGAAIVPYRDSFITLPSSHLMRRLTIEHIGPVKSWLGFRFGLQFGPLRSLLLRVLLNAPLRRKIDLDNLGLNLFLLATIWESYSVGVRAGFDFNVSIEPDPGSKTLKIVTRKFDDRKTKRDRSDAGKVEALLLSSFRDVGRDAGVEKMVFDHSRVSDFIPYAFTDDFWITFNPGDEGVYDMRSLLEVGRAYPEKTASLFRIMIEKSGRGGLLGRVRQFFRLPNPAARAQGSGLKRLIPFGTGQLRAVLKLILLPAENRRLLFCYLKDRAVRNSMDIRDVLKSLCAIEIVRRACAGRLDPRPQYRLEFGFDPKTSSIRIVSKEIDLCAAFEQQGVDDTRSKIIESAIDKGVVTSLVWDHSAFGNSIVYARSGLVRTRRHSFFLGDRGVFDFECILRLYGRFKEPATQVLLSVFRENGADNVAGSGWGLRVPPLWGVTGTGSPGSFPEKLDVKRLEFDGFSVRYGSLARGRAFKFDIHSTKREKLVEKGTACFRLRKGERDFFVTLFLPLGSKVKAAAGRIVMSGKIRQPGENAFLCVESGERIDGIEPLMTGVGGIEDRICGFTIRSGEIKRVILFHGNRGEFKGSESVTKVELSVLRFNAGELDAIWYSSQESDGLKRLSH